jgi:hypothetical protein
MRPKPAAATGDPACGAAGGVLEDLLDGYVNALQKSLNLRFRITFTSPALILVSNWPMRNSG